MVKITNKELIRKAKKVARLHIISNGLRIGDVGCALLTDKNNIYVGVSIHTYCGIGFCAEHSAIAAMFTSGEYKIKRIVAVTTEGIILPPCGRCREFMYQINEENYDYTEIILEENKIVKLKDLLPEPWEKKINKK